jgi:hypothetical protein
MSHAYTPVSSRTPASPPRPKNPEADHWQMHRITEREANVKEERFDHISVLVVRCAGPLSRPGRSIVSRPMKSRLPHQIPNSENMLLSEFWMRMQVVVAKDD